MTTLLLIQGVCFVLLLIGSGFFSSSETALFSLDAHEVNRLGETEPETAARLRSLLQQPTRLLSTLLIGNTFVNVLLWMVGAMFMDQVGWHHDGLQVAVLTGITLIFGEFGPKRLAMQHVDRLCRLFAPPLLGLVHLLQLPRKVLEGLTGTFSHIFMPSGHILTHAEYETLMEASSEAGDLDEHEHTMVRAILSLEGRCVGDIMTPRVDLEGVDLDDPQQSIVDAAHRARTRYLVLYREQLDNIVGLLDVRNYLVAARRDWRRACETPLYVPEVSTLDKLLTQMLSARKRAVIVVDEYGGTAGLVSRGDLLDELTGEMDSDEHTRLVCEPLTERAWLLDGRLSLHDAQRITGLNLSSDTADRLSGWFLEKAEHVPTLNEIIEGPDYKAMVRQMRRNRILLILIEKKAEMTLREDGA